MKFSITLTVSILFLATACSQHTGQPNAERTVRNLLNQEISADSVNAFLETSMKQFNVQGASLIIINDGNVVYSRKEGYSNAEQQIKVTDKTIFEGASLSKPLFAYLVMMDVENGVLDLDRPLYEYLPYEDIAYDERYKKITTRMVLSHTSGFPNWRSDKKDAKLEINFDPGTSFEYSGEGYQYLAKVLADIHQTDDQGLEAIFQERIAKPLKMNFTKYIQGVDNLNHKASPYSKGVMIEAEEVTEEFGAAYSLHTHAEDFSKWVMALLKEETLSASSYNELYKPQVVLPENSVYRQHGVVNWTLGFAEVHMPFGNLYAHAGNNQGYTSLFALNREQKWAVVMFTNENQSQLPLQLLLYLNTPK